jgi:hypothetical protein
LKPLGPDGASWLGLARGLLYRQTFSSSHEPLLEPLGGPSGIADAIRWSERELLFADERGLWIFDLRAMMIYPFGAVAPSERIHSLEVDSRKRVWALGDKIHLLQPSGGDAAIALALAPPAPSERARPRLTIGGTRLFVSMGERGLLVLDADAAARAALERTRAGSVGK